MEMKRKMDEILKFSRYKRKRGDSIESVIDFLKEKNLDNSEIKQVLQTLESDEKEELNQKKEEVKLFSFLNETDEEKEEKERNRIRTLENVKQKDILLKEELRFSQNLTFAIISGIVFSLLAAVLWAFISIWTGKQYVAFGLIVGAIVGRSILQFGKGVDPIFGVVGALFSIWGCILGNVFSIIGFAAKKIDVGYFQAFSKIDSELFITLLKNSFKPWDIFLYIIAAYIGYKVSILKIK